MRRFPAMAVLLMTAGLMFVTPAAAVSPQSSPRVVTTFVPGPMGSFAESMALGPAGDLFVSVTTWMPDGVSNTGRIWRIRPSGTQEPFGPELDAGGGLLTGVAFDDEGTAYVGDATFGYGSLPGVFAIRRDGTAARVLTLPDWSFPNGLAWHAGYLYVSDSTGVIWRTRPRTGSEEIASTPWMADPSLAPESGLGVNGITFVGNVLNAVNADNGTLLRIPVSPSGSPGAVTVVASDPALVTADGIAIDAEGTAWIAVNHETGGALVTVDRSGALRVVADNPGWLDYPSQPVFGPGHSHTLYVENGSFGNGTPNIIALDLRFAS